MVFIKIMNKETVANILIVDDSTNSLEVMCEYFIKKGYNTFKASCAEDSLDLLKTNPVDVAIVDIVLPKMNGLELTDSIRKSYETDVIVITGYGDDYSYEEAISKGASDFIFKPIRVKELDLRLKRVLKERKLKNEHNQIIEKLKELSITDGLTKLYNSRHFYDQLKSEIYRSSRYHHPLSLLLMDIDHFKIYNDSYGHLEGDKVLIGTGRIIKSCLRKLDSAYLYGGDEFTVILPEATGEDAEMVAERIRIAIKNERFYPEPQQGIAVTISIGTTEYSPGEDISSFVKRSDKAMYISKQKGRDKVTRLNA
jgi:diguanylate cyclase (GGDEF)-like protein